MAKTMYERCMAGLEAECEEMIAQVLANRSWMGEADMLHLRQMAAWHFEVTVGEGQVDDEWLREPLLALTNSAKEAGDREGYQIFRQFYQEVF